MTALDWLSPVMAVNVRQARKIRVLTGLVHRMMRDNARLEHEIDALSRRLEQKSRDCELVVQMAKDPSMAKAFLETQGEINELAVSEYRQARRGQ